MIVPQDGPQTEFLSCPADIVFYGGSAGSGKSFALMLEPLRHVENPLFSAVIFRRKTPDLRNPGGLWDSSFEIYGQYPRAEHKDTPLEWHFPSGAKVKFSHMEQPSDRFNWKGSQIPLICFDQLEDFEESMFWYMFSRNRSMSGVRPYIRATANPDADSWLATFLEWWIGEDGYPRKDRAGVIRWFVRLDDAIVWADSKDALIAQYPGVMPKSFTFIPATVFDNKILMERDPNYVSNLMALPTVERERLLKGNWRIKPAAGNVFNRAWFKVEGAAPVKFISRVRYWDKAATVGGDYTVGVLMGKTDAGLYYILDVIRGQWTAGDRDTIMLQTAELDGRDVDVVVEQEPGSAGKSDAASTVRLLAGFKVRAETHTKSKIERAQPYASQAQAGNVRLVAGEWNRAYIEELHNFPDAKHDDQVDASSGAFNRLAASKRFYLV